MTKPKRYKRYSAEFKREAIRRANAEGVSDAEVCAELGISTRQFHRWRDELALLGNDAFPGSGRSRDQELTDLKRELAQVKKECDFLGVLARLAPVAAGGAVLVGVWWVVAQPTGDWPTLARLIERCGVTSAVCVMLVAMIPAVRDDVLRLARRSPPIDAPDPQAENP